MANLLASPLTISSPSAFSLHLDDDLNFYQFFGDLLVSDYEERVIATQAIIERLLAFFQQSSDGIPSHNATSPPSVSSSFTVNHARHVLITHVGSAVRLSLESPYEDVRNFFREFIQLIGTIDSAFAGLRPFFDGPSKFVPKDKCPSIISPISPNLSSPAIIPSPSLSELFEDLFLNTGRVSHIDQLLGWHPSFLSAFSRSMQVIMDEDGPLPQTWRRYIACLAASRHHNEYLIVQQEWEFLSIGGNREWLLNPASVSKKLQSLHELNALLAHQPWKISEREIKTLCDESNEDSWSISELVHAVVILTTFHSLCGFVDGMGISPEIDISNLVTNDDKPLSLLLSTESFSPALSINSPPVPPSPNNAANDQIPIPVAKDTSSHDLSQISALSNGIKDEVLDDDEEDDLIHLLRNANLSEMNDKTLSDVNQRFNAVDADLFKSHISPQLSIDTNGLTPTEFDILSRPLSAQSGGYGHPINNIVSIGTLGLETASLTNNTPLSSYRYEALSQDMKWTNSFQYTQFDVNSKTYKPFFLHEYSWKEQGYTLVNRFCNGFAHLLDAEWDHISSLTYSRVGRSAQSIDTGPFRRAIWFYTMWLYGMCYPDYNYEQVDVLLRKPLKTLIRKVVCFPDQFTAADFTLKGIVSFLACIIILTNLPLLLFMFGHTFHLLSMNPF